MAMVERGWGISILPEMILQRVPYKIEIRPLKKTYYCQIGLVMKNRSHLTSAAKKFTEYLQFRKISKKIIDTIYDTIYNKNRRYKKCKMG